MKFEAIHSLVKGIPYIETKRAKILYDFIVQESPLECLELGFAHGVSSCYIAAALDETGTGHLTSVDLLPAMKWQQPAIEDLLEKTSLGNRVTVIREKTSYTWFLKKMIEQQTRENLCEPIYDFCFIDGPKNWTIDSSAFFLVDKLLKKGGWILFDDYDWTYGTREYMYGVNLDDMGDDERNSPHIELIFKLLVMQHPDYSEFEVEDQTWAWAHKLKSSSNKRMLVTTQTSNLKDDQSVASRGLQKLKKLLTRKSDLAS